MIFKILKNVKISKPSFILKHLIPAYKLHSVVHRKRTMFIQTEHTPNENSIKFIPGKPVMLDNATIEFLNYKDAQSISPLAKELFKIEGVKHLYFGPDFITVTKNNEAEWHLINPDIFGTIMDFFSQDKPIITETSELDKENIKRDTLIKEGDSETVQMIKELIETRIRPSIQEDGGDLEYIEFVDGIVKLKLKGACRTCSSSTVTLKSGIQNMMQYYIPEVKQVEQIQDELDELSHNVFNDFEHKTK